MKVNKSSGISNLTLIILVLIVIILSVGITFGFLYWQKKQQQPLANQNYVPINEEPIQAQLVVADKNLISKADLQIEKVEVDPQVPAYDLPLDLNQVANYQDLTAKIKLNSQAKSLLVKNGFVAVNNLNSQGEPQDDFAAFYSNLKYQDVPIFVTSDSLLHYYHIFFDTTLMKLERDLFYDDIWQMSKELYDDSVNIYNNSDGELKEAAKQNIAYLSVALELLKPKDNQVSNDTTLREEYCYEGMDEEWCNQMVSGVKDTYDDKASLKYFSSQELQKYSFTVPDFVKDTVQKELALIEAHKGFEKSPTFIYKEDYSQYVPRGHYTKTEKLKNYFRAMMWYGRMTALIAGSKSLDKGNSECSGFYDGIISESDAKIQTLQAGLIAKKFLQSENIQTKWQRMYAITSYFVGFSDDLGPFEYGQVLKDVLGNEITSQNLLARYDEFKNKLAELTYEPKIYSGLGACAMAMSCPPLSAEELASLKTQAKNLLSETKGFRLMGQRFTLDSYLFSEIVSPYSGKYSGQDLSLPTDTKPFTFTWDDDYAQFRKNRPFTWVKTDVEGCEEGREVRGFPTGLDIMALFGSAQAKAIINKQGDANYSDYTKTFSALQNEINNLPQEAWFQNLYWNWLYVLQGLIGEVPAGYPTFMQNTAWQDKQLNSALASWTELRHDTILYVKQSYTMAEMGAAMEPPVVGYVEPVPDFYARLLTLTKMTRQGMQKLVPQDQLDNLRVTIALDNFADILTQLIDISKKELTNQTLTEQEYNFIKNFGESSKNLISIVAGGDVDPEILKSPLVADVHTDGNTLNVLEEGVGYIKSLLVAYKLPDDRILMGIGPVFSYYEFKQPMSERLTDEKWKEILQSDNHPDQPDWVKSFTQ